MNWIKAGGQVLQGLVKRREKEWAVYLGYGPYVLPMPLYQIRVTQPRFETDTS
jgi:hypothetical protein